MRQTATRFVMAILNIVLANTTAFLPFLNHLNNSPALIKTVYLPSNRGRSSPNCQLFRSFPHFFGFRPKSVWFRGGNGVGRKHNLFQATPPSWLPQTGFWAGALSTVFSGRVFNKTGEEIARRGPLALFIFPFHLHLSRNNFLFFFFFNRIAFKMVSLFFSFFFDISAVDKRE